MTLTVKRQKVGHGIEIDRENEQSSNPIIRVICSVQLISMIAVTAHSTAMPFLVRIANKTHFLPTTSVFMMEVLKLGFCLIITLFKSGSIKKTCHELHKTIWQNRLETMKVAVPAVVYAIQNNLYYIALANVDPTTYSVTLQIRILTTAALSVCLLNKKLSWYQWGAQVMALLGVVIVQLDKTNSHKEAVGNFWIGVSAVVGMCWTSAFAGVYFEKMLKNSSADVWIQNIRLSILTLFFAGITMITTDGEAVFGGRMFEGWSNMVWLVTILNSVGGLCISLVMKYADNVMKTYCQSIAIGLTSLVSICLGERILTVYLVYGVTLVTSSVVVYSLFPVAPPALSDYHKLEQQDDVAELLKSSGVEDEEEEEDEIFGELEHKIEL
ncbi:Nucleotide Sugar TransPorter family [Caenorhabditis elegans]|uniref:Nucleotide Sugar TransPorter family n=1 Tax=Caenorhabditis elegans TaxID=6239 RepID=H2KY64_CAEEL|nr:Nucleotide Sugar TransPorter family [Caenorhabditis elegans]CCD61332.1 Nucleotide Sugar TransPorter family [Caenorhabditis elegans]|eukprot:NP_741360.1 Nucleotide Sugar TransPorter family [Caenorhabditis elegans]